VSSFGRIGFGEDGRGRKENRGGALKFSTVGMRGEKGKTEGRECFLSGPTFVHPPECGRKINKE
jgi:hypothetical protein